MHNDYVSGGLVLAEELSAGYVAPVGHEYQFSALEMGEGDTFESGDMSWRVLYTPGHPHHVSLRGQRGRQDEAVFTGGSLLFGSVGRPDLIGPKPPRAWPATRWKSVHKLVEGIDDLRPVMPTHGFGSFCSATATVGLESTIGQQATTNPAALLDEHEFVTELLGGPRRLPRLLQAHGPGRRTGCARSTFRLPTSPTRR